MMIDLTAVTKTYRTAATRSGIDDVTLGFPAGSVTALLGRNGAGKTTLLRLIAGLARPDSGSVSVGGRIGVHLGPAAMDPRHTIGQHLRWLAALRGMSRDCIDNALAVTDLADRRAERIRALSLGARQRVAIACTLLGAPQALLFDEPLNGLDIVGIVSFRTLLRRLAGDGCAVIVATHHLDEVALTADRIAVLDRGKLVIAGELHRLVPEGADPRVWLESTLLEHI